MGGPWGGRPKQAASSSSPSRKKPELNQFLLLLYNLLLADMHQSMAFMLNAVWVKIDALQVGSSTCWAQGFFVSNGDLSASLFIAAIAIHTYSVISRNYKPPQWVVNATCIGIWMFTYGLAFIGIAATRNGATSGGFYVRASAWCWINQRFETLPSMDIRLATITVSSIGAAGPEDDEIVDLETNDRIVDESFHHPGFLIYPIIYVVCTLPLALGRIATMAGAEVPLSYFCAAGALITSNGWLDVLLWGSTRRNIIFGDVGEEDVGISTFTFMRTPANRRFGNMVWVEGGVNKNNAKNTKEDNNKTSNNSSQSKHNSNSSSHMSTSNSSRSSSRGHSRQGMVAAGDGLFGDVLRSNVPTGRGETLQRVRDRALRGPRGWLRLGSGGGLTLPGVLTGRISENRSVAASQESLQNLGEPSGGLAIQMETETSVVVEIEDVSQRLPWSHEPRTPMPVYDENDMPDLPPIT
ncbi:hypothetical protein SCUCBS95973_007040 [Sporothrix curviconia]|uniref:Glucose receptor Git3 N-terminal domain-containing protein n=1 Tax=Sporothrix curviconia TaxID=1260050 RepID=A0ABP0CAF9_9PEZI